MKALVIIALVLAGCQDPRLKEIERKMEENREGARKDSIHFKRVEELISSGYTHKEADSIVRSIEADSI